MAAAPGNRYAAKDNRLLTSALVRELVQNPNDALAIAKKLIESAKSGESWAQTLIFERVDGKVKQTIDGDVRGTFEISWPLPKTTLDQ